MIKAVIYDMDGVIIDSEPFWTVAETYGYSKVGINLTEEMRNATRGKREDQVIEYWYSRYPWDLSEISKKELLKIIIDRIIKEIKEFGKPKEGVMESIKFLHSKNVKLGVASSSYQRIIDAALEKFQIKENFDVIYSAEHEPKGKPDPGVYLTTAKKLNTDPENCLCIEDTINGMNAGLNANMKCIVIPDKFQKNEHAFKKANYQLDSLTDLKSLIKKENLI